MANHALNQEQKAALLDTFLEDGVDDVEQLAEYIEIVADGAIVAILSPDWDDCRDSTLRSLRFIERLARLTRSLAQSERTALRPPRPANAEATQ